MSEFEKALKKDIEQLLRSVNRIDDRHTEEGIEIGARWAREWCRAGELSLASQLGATEEREHKLRTENAKLRGALESAYAESSWPLVKKILNDALKETGGDDGEG